MNIIAVQGLGALGQTPVVGESATCKANEQDKALVGSKDDAIRMWNETKAQRWTFLLGGLAVGAAVGFVLWRKR